jgi:hypothetical protein
MTGSTLGDDTRRALALITSIWNGDPESDDPNFLWDLLGEDDLDRLNSVTAMVGILIGAIEGLGGEVEEVIQYMATNVHLLDELDADQ